MFKTNMNIINYENIWINILHGYFLFGTGCVVLLTHPMGWALIILAMIRVYSSLWFESEINRIKEIRKRLEQGLK